MDRGYGLGMIPVLIGVVVVLFGAVGWLWWRLELAHAHTLEVLLLRREPSVDVSGLVDAVGRAVGDTVRAAVFVPEVGEVVPLEGSDVDVGVREEGGVKAATHWIDPTDQGWPDPDIHTDVLMVPPGVDLAEVLGIESVFDRLVVGPDVGE